jgi:Holliday junction resolvase RusA-like endonuclease
MSTTPITLNILGDPKPGGSKTAQALYGKDGKPRLTAAGRVITTIRDDAKGNADWKTTVRVQAHDQYRGEPLTGPLEVRVTFYKARPKGHYNTKGRLTPKALVSPGPTVKPDATKLWRSTEDALTGVVWRDDSQIITQSQAKRWADGRPPGCLIVVRTMEQTANGHTIPQ